MERWKKIPSNSPDRWYMISDLGNIYMEKVGYYDEAGRRRGKSCKYRKIHPEIKRIDLKKTLNKKLGSYEVRVMLEGDTRDRSVALHWLVAEAFVERPMSSEKQWVVFKDGNRMNPAASNLKWIDCKDRKDLKTVGRWTAVQSGIYAVSPASMLYSEYQKFLDNKAKTAEIVLDFMKREGLQCGLVKVGWENTIKKTGDKLTTVKAPYFCINDRDPAVFEHDIKQLGDQVRRGRRNGFRMINRRSPTMKRWLETLEEKQFEIMDEPSLEDFITLRDVDEDKEPEWLYSKAFRMENGNLYVKIDSDVEFDVGPELTPVKGKEYLF